MKVEDFAQGILFGESMADKLFFPQEDLLYRQSKSVFEIPKKPGRSQGLLMSHKQLKFPKKGILNQAENRGKALHFFANHELLAIEMMAAIVLKLPSLNDEVLALKKEIIFTIKDEQKHLSLYIKRMRQLGVEFGDHPLNDFFWKQIHQINNFSQYFSIMSLTFEAANLDFAKYYGKIFSNYEDFESSKIMETIYLDEIKHVGLGVKWLNKWKKSKSLWQYYNENLPYPITPGRSKGIEFSPESRGLSGFDAHFIDYLKNYNDSFKITNRKTSY